MPCNTYIQPIIATVEDSNPWLNVSSTTPGGELQIVTTGATVNTIGPDRYIMVGDVIIGPGHYKVVPQNYHVDGNITIESELPITIGAETIRNEGYVSVEGYINCTGTIDVQGTLFPGDKKVAVE